MCDVIHVSSLSSPIIHIKKKLHHPVLSDAEKLNKNRNCSTTSRNWTIKEAQLMIDVEAKISKWRLKIPSQCNPEHFFSSSIISQNLFILPWPLLLFISAVVFKSGLFMKMTSAEVEKVLIPEEYCCFSINVWGVPNRIETLYNVSILIWSLC